MPPAPISLQYVIRVALGPTFLVVFDLIGVVATLICLAFAIYDHRHWLLATRDRLAIRYEQPVARSPVVALNGGTVVASATPNTLNAPLGQTFHSIYVDPRQLSGLPTASLAASGTATMPIVTSAQKRIWLPY